MKGTAYFFFIARFWEGLMPRRYYQEAPPEHDAGLPFFIDPFPIFLPFLEGREEILMSVSLLGMFRTF